MTDDKESKAVNAPAPEIAAESIEPVPTAAPAQSQAVLDIKEAGLTPEEAAAASQALAEESEKKSQKSKRPENLAAIASFRWLVLLILALASVATWAVDSQFFSHRPYTVEAWGLLGITVLLGLLSFKMFRLPTRAGLAALCWSGTFFIDALYGPSQYVLDGVTSTSATVSSGGIPAVLPWAGLLTLIFIWVLVAIWRKLGRYTVIDIILGIVLFYAALGSLWGPLSKIFHSAGALSLNFSALSTSPDALTAHLPWFLWPMTVMVFFILPLAALFALWDQCSALRRKGGRHGGNFFLALAFILLLPYAFLTYDQAVAENPGLVAAFEKVRVAVGATEMESPATLTAKPAVEVPAPAPAAETAVTLPAAPEAEQAVTEVPTPALPPVTEKAAEPAPAATPAVPEPTPAPVEAAPVAAVIPAEPAPAIQPGVDPAVVTALEERLKKTETRLQETEADLKDASARLEKTETGLAEAVSGLTEARKQISGLEKQVQELLAAPHNLDEAIDQRIQSLPGSAKPADEGTSAPAPAPAESGE